MIGILLCKLKACATEKWGQKNRDNDVYDGLYSSKAEERCAQEILIQKW